MAKILGVSEQRVVKSKKILRVKIKSVRNKSGYMIRYILYSDIENEKLKKGNKGETG